MFIKKHNKLFILKIIVLIHALGLTACTNIYHTASIDDPNWAPALPEENNLSANNPGAIYNPITTQHLFQDRKALRAGDIVTIVLTERTNATKTADTDLSKNSNTSLAAPSVLGNLLSPGGGITDLSVATGAQDRSFTAESDSSQSNQLQGTITVTVHQVYPNGNLLIKGEKWISLNQGSEFIRLAGIVRPEDIDKDNQVQSTRVANARISYGGTGPLAETNQVGWLTRFFNSSWWPF